MDLQDGHTNYNFLKDYKNKDVEQVFGSRQFIRYNTFFDDKGFKSMKEYNDSLDERFLKYFRAGIEAIILRAIADMKVI